MADRIARLTRRQGAKGYLVGLWDCVAFDEVAGIHFKDKDGVQIMKDYMASGSFARGKEEKAASASMVFVGNINQSVDVLLKTSSGIDITAYKDELPPRILVQVKSQDGDIKETTIQSLKGAMREGDYGLFVTLSNYTKNAKKYLENTPIIRGINGTELVELVLKYYDQLSEKYQKMIPLKMVYIPVTLDTDSK